MTLPRRDPYLWIHLAGLATVPLWLDLCLSGLAVGDPVVPPWLELTTLGWVGTVPILWMQLQRPFYIFSIPGLAIRPDQLSEDRRRLLTIQRGWLSRLLVCASAIALFFLLYWLYQLAPIAADMTPFASKSRAEGWLICAIAFFFANLFVQVPATVVPLLLTSPQSLERTPPIESSAILSRFMVLGLRVRAILPDFPVQEAETLTSVASEPTAAEPSAQPLAAVGQTNGDAEPGSSALGKLAGETSPTSSEADPKDALTDTSTLSAVDETVQPYSAPSASESSVLDPPPAEASGADSSELNGHYPASFAAPNSEADIAKGTGLTEPWVEETESLENSSEELAEQAYPDQKTVEAVVHPFQPEDLLDDSLVDLPDRDEATASETVTTEADRASLSSDQDMKTEQSLAAIALSTEPGSAHRVEHKVIDKMNAVSSLAEIAIADDEDDSPAADWPVNTAFDGFSPDSTSEAMMAEPQAKEEE